MAPLGELKKGDGFEIDASLDKQWGILVELEGTFSEEYSLNGPSIVYFSEVTAPVKLINHISIESLLNLAPTPPISPLSFRSPFVFLL